MAEESAKRRFSEISNGSEGVAADGGDAPAPKRKTCPYLDTINRHMLDFDFEKVCSVSLSNFNVYACLVCGKYFQGRGRTSHAYYHSLQSNHHVFINLHNEKVYCLPDGYQVEDSSLDDIKRVLNPLFTESQVTQVDTKLAYSRALDGSNYLPGTIGLNNIKSTDFLNVVVQALVHVPPLRDFFLIAKNYENNKSLLVQRFGELVRKVWHPLNFKDQVSPHELLQAVSLASNKKFRPGQQSDPLEFLSWFLNTLHRDLGGTKKRNSSIIFQVFQGEIEITSVKPDKEKMAALREQRGETIDADENEDGEQLRRVPLITTTDVTPFLFLALDLPPAPLFKDAQEKNIIPQVPLFTLLTKFDGVTVQDLPLLRERRRYRINRLPKYLIFHVKRFTKNNFFTEKNPTIVNFPVKNLELRDYLDANAMKAVEAGLSTKYDLVANICHQGRPEDGSYLVHVLHKANEQWYEMQDLNVSETMPQIVALSEALIQIYECKPLSASKPTAPMDAVPAPMQVEAPPSTATKLLKKKKKKKKKIEGAASAKPKSGVLKTTANGKS